MNAKVKRPANIFACVFGGIGAVVMGGGMSLVMTDLADTIGIKNPILWGVIVGVTGMLMTIANYPIYKNILASRRKAAHCLRSAVRASEKEKNVCTGAVAKMHRLLFVSVAAVRWTLLQRHVARMFSSIFGKTAKMQTKL